MKKYIKILIPSLSLVIAPFTITSCKKHTDKDIPKQYLKITDGLLEGFDKDHQHEQDLDGCNTLVIPKDVTQLTSNCFSTKVDLETEYTAPNAIKTVTYEEGCQIDEFGGKPTNVYGGTNFNFLTKLETVYFPPSYQGNFDKFLFEASRKVSKLDLSQCTNLKMSSPRLWVS